MAGSGVIGGGFAGSIGSNKFEMSLYNETKATPVFVAGTLSHFTVHFTVGVSRETKMKVEKNGVATGGGMHDRERRQHLFGHHAHGHLRAERIARRDRELQRLEQRDQPDMERNLRVGPE